MADPVPGIDALAGAVPQMDSIAGLGTGAPGAGNTPAPDPAAPKMSFLQHILKALPYAMAGAAAGGAARTPGAGAAAGAAAGAEMVQTQQRMKFQNLESAHLALVMSKMDQDMHNAGEEHQEMMQKFADEHAAFLQDKFGVQLTPLPNTAQSANDHLQSHHDASGGAGIATPAAVMGPHTMYSVNAGQDTAKLLDAYNAQASALGMASMAPAMWNRLGVTGQNRILSEMTMRVAGYDPARGELLDVKTLPSIIADREAKLKLYQQNPNYSPDVAKQIQSGVDVMKARVAGQTKADSEAAASKAAAVASAEGPIKTQQAVDQAKALLPIETEKAQRIARAQQAINQGKPEDAGTLMANGDLTLSELKSRGTTPAFITAATNAAKKLDPNFNPQQAEAEFNVAKSPENVKFFGSAKSLTDKGGTLDQLVEAAKDLPGNQVPVFNTIADAAKAATGSGPIAKYAAVLLGVADDYSKVMGGGQGSDTSREQALKLAPTNASPEARKAAIEGIRGAVNSQMASRIGGNRVLRRMYGEGVQMTPAASKQYDFSDPTKYPKAN